MGKDSKIEWCDHSFNPWTGCAKVSEGCQHCYAEGWAKRSGLVEWGPGKPRHRTSEAKWREPLKWNRNALNRVCSNGHLYPANYANLAHGKCYQCGERWEEMPKPRRPRVFCASLADWLDDEVPIEWLADMLNLIRATPYLDWLLLTKRPHLFFTRLKDATEHHNRGDLQSENARTWAWLNDWWRFGLAPDNIWIGTTVENQKRADERIPQLLEIPARVRFLSCEPLLEPVDLFRGCFGPDVAFGRNHGPALRFGVDWVIAGGESGNGARPMDADWARSLRDQCQAARVPLFMKQMGGARKPFPEIPEDLAIREFPSVKLNDNA